MRFISSLSLAATILAAAGSAQAERPTNIDADRDGTTQLEYRFGRGDSHSFIFDWSYESERLEGGRTDRSTVQISMPITYEVQSADDSGGVIATSLQSPTVTREENGEPAEVEDIVQGLRSARLTLTVAHDGTVSEESGGINTGNPANATIIGFLDDTLSLQWVQFPREPVAIGDSWLQMLHQTEGTISSTLSARYTLIGFSREAGRDLAVIDTEYTYAVSGQASATRSARASRVVARGDGSGYILFDHQRGQISELAIRLGTIFTTTETSGFRTSMSFVHEGSLRAQVIGAAAVPE